MADQPLRVKRNNQRTLLISITSRDNQGRPHPYPLTSCRVEVFVKDGPRDEDPNAVIATITDSNNGYAEAVIDTGEVGTRWRRIDVYRLDTQQRVTVDAGPLIVEPA